MSTLIVVIGILTTATVLALWYHVKDELLHEEREFWEDEL